MRVVLAGPLRRDGPEDAASPHVHWHRACLVVPSRRNTRADGAQGRGGAGSSANLGPRCNTTRVHLKVSQGSRSWEEILLVFSLFFIGNQSFFRAGVID